MDKSRLQALRRLLFLSRQEAALWVAAGADRPQGVTDRSWRMWEGGTRNIPDDVADNIERLSVWRTAAIKAQSPSGRGAKLVILPWFDSLDSWLAAGNEAILWRPQQSVCAAICAAFDSVRLETVGGANGSQQRPGSVRSAVEFQPLGGAESALDVAKTGKIDGVRFFR